MRAFLSLFFILMLLGCAQKPVATEAPNSRIKPSFGIKFSTEVVRFAKPLPNGADSGLKLEVVFPYFPAAKAGLQTGDILIGFEKEIFKGLKEDEPLKFAARLSQLKLGEKVQFHVLRSKDQGYYQINGGEKIALREGELPPLDKLEQALNSELTASWKKTQEIKSYTVPVQTRNWSYGDQPLTNAKLWPKFKKEKTLQNSVEKQVHKNLVEERQQLDLKDLEGRLEELALFADEKRLPLVSYLQQNPFEIENFQNFLYEKARTCRQTLEPWPCLQELLSAVQPEGQPLKKVGPLDFKSPDDFLKAVAKTTNESNKILQSAFENLNASELIYFKEHSPGLAKQLTQNLYLHEDSDKNRLVRDLKLMNLIQKVKTGKILQSLFANRSVLNQETIQNLQIFAQQTKNSSKEILAQFKSSEGIFLIGGHGDNDYTQFSGQNVVFILDLGGNDYYPDISANVIDLNGNDRYQSASPWTLNSGFFRTRYLMDLSGNDIYRCSTGCLSSSLFGASLLLDLSGNDIYRSHSFSLGSSLGGFSAFIDFKGQDQYESSIFSQGVGIGGGIGLLLDYAGDDSYLSKEQNPSGYGDPGQFDGWSQGVGIGLRNFVSGGWGLLYDGEGKDQFESGTFSQGGGYYFGLGSLINDGDQNDYYLGARYSQGFSAHYAIGNFLEAGGNDIYSSPSFVGQGMAWDLSLTLFEDRAGDDQYKTCEHCLGVGSQNSIAFFVDSKGNDHYRGMDLPYKQQRYNDYHGGKSLGLFWDLGKTEDQYQSLKNNSSQMTEGWQILIDQ